MPCFRTDSLPLHLRAPWERARNASSNQKGTLSSPSSQITNPNDPSSSLQTTEMITDNPFLKLHVKAGPSQQIQPLKNFEARERVWSRRERALVGSRKTALSPLSSTAYREERCRRLRPTISGRRAVEGEGLLRLLCWCGDAEVPGVERHFLGQQVGRERIGL